LPITLSFVYFYALLPPVTGVLGLGPVPGVSQFRLAPCQFAPGPGRVSPDEREWLSQGVAAVHTGNGGGTHGSRLVTARGVALSGSTVAPASDDLKHGVGG